MKFNKIILTGVLATTMMGGAFASTTIEDSTAALNTYDDTTSIELAEVVAVESEQNKKEVKLTALPAPVIDALKSEQYVAWKAEKAYKYKEDGETVYEILVKQGADQATLYFNEEGMAIEK